MLVPASFTCCHMDVKSALLTKTMEAWRVPCLYSDYEFVTGGLYSLWVCIHGKWKWPYGIFGLVVPITDLRSPEDRTLSSRGPRREFPVLSIRSSRGPIWGICAMCHSAVFLAWFMSWVKGVVVCIFYGLILLYAALIQQKRVFSLASSWFACSVRYYLK